MPTILFPFQTAQVLTARIASECEKVVEDKVERDNDTHLLLRSSQTRKPLFIQIYIDQSVDI
jgi:hypothetical protein